MKNWLKKVLSLLIALALLVSAGALAFAENNGEPIDTAAADNAAQTEAEEEAARKAAEEEAARKAAEEEAARKAAEEEAARKAAEEEAARKAAEEEAARKAAEEEAARKAAEEEAARQAAEEEAAAQEAADQAAAQEAEEEAPAQETAEEVPQKDESVPTYSNEETPESTSAPEDDDDTVEIDGWGYVDPEIIPDYVPDVTTEIKFPEAVELRLNQAVSGSVDAENSAEYIFVYGSSKTVVLSLDASSEDVNVAINKKTVRFTKDETVTSGFSGSCELNVTAGDEYDIVLTSSSPVNYTLIVKDADAVQEENKPEETKPEGSTAGKTEGKENGSKPATGSNDVNTSDTKETAGNENSGTNAAAPVEEEAPPMTGWISANGENFHIGDTVTLKAESESVLGDMVAWQTKVGNEGNWKGAGYGGTLTVELTEENNNSAYRFRMEDGNYSSEYVLTAAAEVAEDAETAGETEAAEEETEKAEQPEETEETKTEKAEESEELGESGEAEATEAGDTETAEEGENEETAETEEPAETEDSEETEDDGESEETVESKEAEEPEEAEKEYVKVIVTAEEGADLYAEADREAEVTGHLDAGEEALVILDEEKTWGRLYSEDNEAAPAFISMEDAAEVTETEETEEEETEEGKTESEEPAEDETEQLTALGFTKIIVTAEEGADLYADADWEAEVIGHLDAEAEAWVLLNEDQTWGRLYSEDEEAAPAFISMEDAAVAEESEEEAEEPAEDETEQMTALGFTKIIVTAEEGADLYADADREAEVIGHLDAGTEAWVFLNEDQTWGRLYNEDEEAAPAFISMEDAEVEETEEDKLEKLGYRKVQVLNQNGTDIYDSMDENASAIDHVETGAELWIKNTEAEGWAQIYTAEDEDQKYVLLADLEKQPHTDEEMLEMGYVKVYVAIDIGANVYAGKGKKAKQIDHLDVGTELWVEILKKADRARIIDPVELKTLGYINLVDIVAILKPEGMEELPVRELELHSNLEDSMVTRLFVGAEVHLWADLINFKEDDRYEVKWQYSADGKEYFDIQDADELEFSYVVDMDNGDYTWKIIVKLVSDSEELITAEE